MKLFSRYEFEHLLFLAPLDSARTAHFGSLEVDALQYDSFLSEIQRLRGRVYLKDGAITPSHLTPDGRFVHPQDTLSWNLAILDDYGEVAGCARYAPHEHHIPFRNLAVSGSALAHCPIWGSTFRHAIQVERAVAQIRRVGYAELGGWALSEELRYTTAAFKICLHFYALMKRLGGAMAITTATIRHHSSSILRKMGGRSLVISGAELPSYFDSQYGCQMEVLMFDSDHPAPKYQDVISDIQSKLGKVVVLSSPALVHTAAMLQSAAAGAHA